MLRKEDDGSVEVLGCGKFGGFGVVSICCYAQYNTDEQKGKKNA